MESKRNGLSAMIAGGAGLLALIAGLASVTRPIQYQMEALEARVVRVESRTIDSMKKLDDKLQIEIAGQARMADSHQAGLRLLQAEAEVRSKANAALTEQRADANAAEITTIRIKVAALEERIENLRPEKE